ncbi:PDR/VanB family oxidoreductase [Halocynthiibacter sp.]|uniref:PDR/VanB family oxidoreductase n=1 Tax=Halocynthiibacter sp. TaxID=1979210 RepID=UPI003C3667D5
MNRSPAQLTRKTQLSPDTYDFRFEKQYGSFEGLEPGAHIDIHLSSDLVRQYSVWKWDADATALHVAVKIEDQGRGGSLAMHALEEGAIAQLGGPRNHFHLEENSSHKLLVAGGIGATPIFAMAQALKNQGADFQLLYLTRSKDFAAFDTAFQALELRDQYRLHCDDQDGMIDLPAVLHTLPVGSDIYTCGPEPMLNALLDAGSSLRGGCIHFERFAAAAELSEGENKSFDVEIQSTGNTYTIGPDETILGVLSDQGIHVDFGCSEGLCGSCIVDVIEGEVDHRDGMLSPEEKATNEFMCVCVSRAKYDKIVLDL